MPKNWHQEENLATAAPCTFEEVGETLASSNLVRLPAVQSVNMLRVDSEVSVWVGVSEDSRAIRSTIYAVEDVLAGRFPGLMFAVHVVPVPTGRHIEEFVSESRSVYRRIAA